MTDELCAARITDNSGWFTHQCSRRGTVEENGKRWCKTHAPSFVRARDQARTEQRQREWDQRDRAAEMRQRLAFEAELRRRVAALTWREIDRLGGEMASPMLTLDERRAALLRGLDVEAPV